MIELMFPIIFYALLISKITSQSKPLLRLWCIYPIAYRTFLLEWRGLKFNMPRLNLSLAHLSLSPFPPNMLTSVNGLILHLAIPARNLHVILSFLNVHSSSHPALIIQLPDNLLNLSTSFISISHRTCVHPDYCNYPFEWLQHLHTCFQSLYTQFFFQNALLKRKISLCHSKLIITHFNDYPLIFGCLTLVCKTFHDLTPGNLSSWSFTMPHLTFYN